MVSGSRGSGSRGSGSSAGAAAEETSLRSILGTGASKLAKERGLTSIGDLLRFWPRSYRDWKSDLGNLHIGQYLVTLAEVKQATTRPMKSRRGRMLEVVITDGDQDLDVTFFKPYGHEGKLVPGTLAVWAGQVSAFRNRLQLAHPDYEVVDAASDELAQRGLMPVYRRTKGVRNWEVVKAVGVALDHLDDLPDAVPVAVRRRRFLVDRLTAYRLVHQPQDFGDVKRARHRLRYEEAFVLQCALAVRRAEQAQEATVARPRRAGGLLDAFEARLPFRLTAGQHEVGELLEDELAREVPMHRLLQGDVGSGKTVVALRAMLAAVDAGGQAALLAPTEVLAAQHHRTITAMLGDLAEGGLLGGSDLGTRVVLLTGSQSTATRRQAMLDVASGEAGIVVGTHALIQDKVDFFDLALVVVDEQHRFGVEQRDALRAKGRHPPHVLTMTATPIPRTVAMTVFGDMEVATLRELPAGRSPIVTHVVPETRPGWVERTWQRVAEEVRQGRQAYVVCPRIGGEAGAGNGGPAAGEEVVAPPTPGRADGAPLPDEDDLGAVEAWDEAETAAAAPQAERPWASVVEVHDELTRTPALSGLRVEALHGRLPADEKDAVMGAFARGEIDVLVATTVIEVGVDVANATVMVVMDAERFGVSQLHQLRGRVGRGEHRGLCLLMTGSDAEAATERLEAVAATTDGFELARLDLAQRREGDVLGTRQSGAGSQLEFLSLLRDEDLIVTAREDAFGLVDADPTLADHPALAAAVAVLREAEQASYLEKG